MPVIACAPHCSDFPAPVAVVVAVWAGRWWHDHPAALGRYEVANEVVRELVTRFGHGDVVPRATDRRRTTSPATGVTLGANCVG
jgi:hypothetical protein